MYIVISQSKWLLHKLDVIDNWLYYVYIEKGDMVVSAILVGIKLKYFGGEKNKL